MLMDTDEVILPYEVATTVLASYFDNSDIAALPTLPFRLRLDLLYYRCRLITLDESVKIIRTLTALQPQSQHVEALAEGLRMMTIEQSLHNVKALETLVAESKTLCFIRLEVELRMLQMSFHMLLRKYSVTGELDMEACMKRALNLCYRHPNTAGNLLQSVKMLQARLAGRGGSRRLFTADAMVIWRKWGYYTIGHLAHCSNGHPFSTADFLDCPECEPSIESSTKREVDYNAHLQEDAFLQRLHEARVHIPVEGGSSFSSDWENGTRQRSHTASHSSNSSFNGHMRSTSVSSNAGSGLEPAPANNKISHPSMAAPVSGSPSANWIPLHLRTPMPCTKQPSAEKKTQDSGVWIVPDLQLPTPHSGDITKSQVEMETPGSEVWIAPHLQPPKPRTKDSKGGLNKHGTQDGEAWIAPRLQPSAPRSEDSKGSQNRNRKQDRGMWIAPHLRGVSGLDHR